MLSEWGRMVGGWERMVGECRRVVGGWWEVGGGDLPDPAVRPGDAAEVEELWTGEGDLVLATSLDGYGAYEATLLTDRSDLCIATFAVESVQPTDACDSCLWAFEMRQFDVQVDEDVDCERVEFDAGEQEGATFGLGFHADVVYVDVGDGWIAAGSGWLDGQGGFRWEWEEGFEG